jgi:hypothetical protein
VNLCFEVHPAEPGKYCEILSDVGIACGRPATKRLYYPSLNYFQKLEGTAETDPNTFVCEDHASTKHVATLTREVA